jgi:hypothetical protein
MVGLVSIDSTRPSKRINDCWTPCVGPTRLMGSHHQILPNMWTSGTTRTQRKVTHGDDSRHVETQNDKQLRTYEALFLFLLYLSAVYVVRHSPLYIVLSSSACTGRVYWSHVLVACTGRVSCRRPLVGSSFLARTRGLSPSSPPPRGLSMATRRRRTLAHTNRVSFFPIELPLLIIADKNC